MVDNNDDIHDGEAENILLLGIATAAMIYQRRKNTNFISRMPCRNSSLQGAPYLAEVLNGHPKRCYENFRMTKEMFEELCQDLHDKYMLRASHNIQISEMLGMFLYILGQGASNRAVQEIFQHSGETVSRIFRNVLCSVYDLAMDIIKPREGQFEEVHAKLKSKPRFRPFKNCIGAIDGTHIPAVISKDKKAPYIGRKGITTQNVMAACDFDMLYIFVSAGWEGSAHDARVFQNALTNERLNFPKPPQGKYYLVDAGYPNKTGYLAPYRGEKYHLSDFPHGYRPTGSREQFNRVHSSLRNVIERTFGVTKKKWKILSTMPSYPFQIQVYIVIACMALHNYIRLRVRSNTEFENTDVDESISVVEDTCGEGSSRVQNQDDGGIDLLDDSSMARVRDKIAEKLYSMNI